MSHDDRRLLADSAEGTSRADFRPTDWGQLGLTAAIFGSAFLWISLALESIEPGLLSFGRVVLGAATLALIPGHVVVSGGWTGIASSWRALPASVHRRF